MCEANFSFVFKALQKEHPFLTLMTIFILTCVCFGFSCRIFELYYWETQIIKLQDWTYEWNALWCIFVSMTTVGYGDFYPKTHVGRFIVIIACTVGIYFVSIMMVFMTQNSILNETEFKAYKLITRLKLRNEIKDIQSEIVFHAIKKKIAKIKKTENTTDVNYELIETNEKRKIFSLIKKMKEKNRSIKSFEFIPTKEQLFDICERINSDIKEIKQEMEALDFLTKEVQNFTDSQIETVKCLKKNVYSTKRMYHFIANNKIFGKLNNVNMNILLEDNTDINPGLLNKKSSSKINKDINKKGSLEKIDENNNDNKNSFINFIEKGYENIENIDKSNENKYQEYNNMNIPEETKNNNKRVSIITNAYENNNANDITYENENNDNLLHDSKNKNLIDYYNVTSDQIKSHFDIIFGNKKKIS